MEKTIFDFVAELGRMTDEEDLGLLLLMQQVGIDDTVIEKDFLKALEG